MNKKTNINGVSVITCTNRINFIDNILSNYLNQDYKNKELIIIINNDDIDLSCYLDKINDYKDIFIYKLNQNLTLGKCLNFAVSKSKYDIISKFDDDDYYSPNYLKTSIDVFDKTKADIIGKSSIYIYFKQKNLLTFKSTKKENKYVNRIEGSTLNVKKYVFDKVCFQDKNLGEDIMFCSDCIKTGFKIYSNDKSNYVYIRHGINHNHTFNMPDELLIKICTKIGYISDFKAIVDK